MGLETGTYINDLVQTNPAVSDQEAQGANHLQLIKKVLQNTFPNASRAFPFPTTSVATSPGPTITRANWNTTFLCDTSGGQVGINLPSLTSADAGWECSIIKTNTGTSPVFIAPPTGTIQSGEIAGLAYCRRCIPGLRTRVLWTGTAWIAERGPRDPVGTLLPYSGSTLPVGYEWPNGQTLAGSNGSVYPEIFAIWGALITPDLRGNTLIGVDNMGGAAANRITNAGCGIVGTTLGATGGSQNQTISQAQLPAVNLSTAGVTVAPPTISYSLNANNTSGAVGSNGLNILLSNVHTETLTAGPINSITASAPAVSGTVALGGGGTALITVQPAIMMNFILVTE